jgi:rsbT antagonist protein RsbS
MERIPILQMGDLLLVTIQVDMHDQLALTLQDDLSEKIRRTSARGVLIDISALDIVDSFIGRMISTISSIARIMDATTVVVGMQPAVAITLVELGLTLSGVRTALNVERGMKLLQRTDDHAP